MPLYDMVYESRFRRLRAQFRASPKDQSSDLRGQP
jgi:hypothetical protein